MRISVEEIKKITPSRPLVVRLKSKLECFSTRNLVSYVNLAYPVDGYRYRTHITEDFTAVISLVEGTTRKLKK